MPPVDNFCWSSIVPGIPIRGPLIWCTRPTRDLFEILKAICLSNLKGLSPRVNFDAMETQGSIPCSSWIVPSDVLKIDDGRDVSTSILDSVSINVENLVF